MNETLNTLGNMNVLGAGLAIGLAGFGVALGQGILAKKSMDVMGKNPDIMNKFLILTILALALIEAAAIYGLIIAFQIVGKPDLPAYRAIAAGLSVGLAAAGAGIGQGLIGSGALESVLRNPEVQGKIMVNMILTIALVEAVAIYGLIIAFQLVS